MILVLIFILQQPASFLTRQFICVMSTMRQVVEEQRPHLSRCPVSANQKPGLGGFDQSEARKDREPDRCPEIQNTLIRGERERREQTEFNSI